MHDLHEDRVARAGRSIARDINRFAAAALVIGVLALAGAAWLVWTVANAVAR